MTIKQGEETKHDVVVVGGGLSGLTTTLALSKCGLSVAMIDREPAHVATRTDRDGRTTAIAASGQSMLVALGLWPALEAGAEPILDIRVSDGDSRHFLHYDHREAGDRPMGHIIENAALKRALLDAVADASSVTLMNGATVAGIETGPAEITAALENGGGVTGRLLVGADGRGGATRGLAGIRATRIDYGQTSMVFNITHEHPHHGVAHERFLPGGPLAVLPMRGNRSSVVWTERTETARELMTLDDAAFADALSLRFQDALGRLAVDGKRGAYPLSLVNADRQTAPRLVLAGDAAHGIHPIAGQGFNLGLRDVASLADEVAEAARLGLDIGGPEVLRRYQAHRRFDTMSLVLATDGINRLFSNDIAPVKAVRSAGLGLVNRIPPLKKAFMRHAMGLMGDLPSMLQGRLP